MRVLHVLDHSLPLQSGYSFRTRAIIEQQRALGWETFHVTGSKHYGSEALEERVDGLSFYRTPPGGGLRRVGLGLDQLAVIRSLERRVGQLVARLRPDLIHAHSPALCGVAALRAARRSRLPVVYELRALWEDAAVNHGTCREGDLRYRLTRALETYVLRRATAVTTICDGLSGEILSRGVDPAKVTVVPNAVNLEEFPLAGPPNAALAARLGVAGATTLGFVGSFYAYEGLDLLLRAAPRIFADAPGARMLLVGGGPQDAALRREAARLGIDGRVVFTGRVHHSEVAEYYGLLDVLVYPRHSIRLTELVTPLKPLEAMAQGKLVVASDIGGHREMIRQGVTGELFPPGDPGGLAKAVRRLLTEPESWSERQRLARRYIESERSWQVVARTYERVYGRALARAAA